MTDLQSDAASLAGTILDLEAERQTTADTEPVIADADLPGVGDELSLRDSLRIGGTYTLAVLTILNSLDELESATLGTLAPDIRDSLGVSNGTIVFMVTAASAFLVLGALPMGWLADRYRRGPIIAIASMAFSGLVLLSGFAVNAFMLLLTRLGVGFAKSNTLVVHGSLLADQYPIATRGRVNAVTLTTGRIVGTLSPLVVGGVAALAGGSAGWRWAFFLLAIPVAIAAWFAFRLPEPPRGQFEKQDVLGEVIEEDRPAPVSVEAAFARLLQIGTIRSAVFAFASLGFGLFTVPVVGNIFLEEHYDLDSFGRGAVGTASGIAVLFVLPFVGRAYDASYRRDPTRALRMLAWLILPTAVLTPLQFFMPNPVLYAIWAMVPAVLLSSAFACVGPLLQTVVPYQLRGMGGALGSIYLFFVGAVGGALLSALLVDTYGPRLTVTLIVLPSSLVGALLLLKGSTYIKDDLAMIVSDLREEMAEHERLHADVDSVPALQVSHIDFAYGPVQILFDVSFEVRTGETLALLGTNGAGKSTVLKAISGLGTPSRGAVRHHGRSITYVSPENRTRAGILLLPGGKSVFGDMTIRDNLEMATWNHRADAVDLERRITGSLEMFPELSDRHHQLASSLSGGEQQLLALAGVLACEPEILMIDELSLGLAPVVVERLVEVIGELQKRGMTIIVVEQSLNVAAAIAQRAVFLEKGHVRFEGPIADLVERDDLVRAVFLGAEGGLMLAALYTQQVIVDGLVQGLVYGLLAMAIVLVHRSTKVINFAAGNMGLVGAGVFVMCEVNYGIPFWLSLAIALGVGILWGAIIDLVVVRRLFRAPRVILLVATIGVAQLSLLLLNAFPDVVGERLPWPQVISTTVELGDATIAGPQLVILVVAPLIAIALSLFLNRTPIGRTVRAAAGDPDLARLRGINPKLLSTLVWAIAGLLSTAAIIMRTGLDGTTLGLQGVGAATLLRALIAAVVAGLSSFRTALVAAVLIGVGESLIRFNFISQPGVTEVVLLVVVLVAVGAQGRRGSSAWPSTPFSFIPEARALPARLRGIWWVRNLDRLVLLVFLAAAVVVPFLVTQPSKQLLYTTIAAFAVCALSLTVLTGWAGQLSLGQMSLAGVGALTGAAFARGLLVDWIVADRQIIFLDLYGVPFVLSMVIGAVVASLVAVLIGAGALRVQGLMLAVTTFAFALASDTWLYKLEIFTAGSVSTVPYRRGELFGVDLRDQRNYYFLALAVLVITMGMLGRIRRSGIGRVTLAVRDNSDSAAAYTVNPAFVKLRAFALAGLVAGFGGAVLGGATQQIPLNDSFFTVDFSLTLVAMVVIGGMGSTAGAVIGALWVIGLPALFPDNDLFPLLASSIGLLVLLLYFPGGFVHVAHQTRSALYDWLEGRLPAVEKRTVVPPAAIGRTDRAQPDVEVALLCRDIQVRFGGVQANAGIDLEVRNGEIVGLIGTNGAGKSTFMNAVGGFVPSTGSVELLGTELHGRSSSARARLGLGRTFQTARLFPELTVRQSVQVTLEARGRTSLLEVALFSPRAAKAERRKQSEAEELIDFLGLGRYADKRVSVLSTGTRRIVELAGLLALDARVLCLDEPTAGVAQREAEAMGPLLVEIRRQLGASMLIIEHDMPLIMGMSDRVYCLELGRVIAEGDPVAVRNNPLVIASYLGTDERTIARSGAVPGEAPGATAGSP